MPLPPNPARAEPVEARLRQRFFELTKSTTSQLRHFPKNRGAVTLATALLATTLTACTTTQTTPPEITISNASYNTTSTSASGEAQTFTQADIPAQWWTLFQSPKLDQLVRTALDHSPNLAAAQARLKQAQELYAAQSGATTLPRADASLGVTRQQINTAAMGIKGIPNPPSFTLYNASVNVSYDLDIFGANRHALESSAAQTEFAQFQWQAARQALAGNVVTTAIRHASTQEQLATLDQLIAAQSQQLAILQKRYELGGVAQIDLQNQQSLLAQAQAQKPALQKSLTQSEHQLAVLLGQSPLDTLPATPTLSELHLPATVPLSLPSQLARQRPDIRASEAELRQASAEVGVASANLYPQFTLTGSLGSERLRAGDTFDGVNVWSIGGRLMQPLFRGGELRAKKRAAINAYEAAEADYRQTVLKGLQEVADTLAALQVDADAVQARNNAADASAAVYATAEKQYALGGVSQLNLLDSQRQQLQTQLDRTRAQADRYSDTAALLQALGGGWWNEAVAGK